MYMYVRMCVYALLCESSQALLPRLTITRRKEELLPLFFFIFTELSIL